MEIRIQVNEEIPVRTEIDGRVVFDNPENQKGLMEFSGMMLALAVAAGYGVIPEEEKHKFTDLGKRAAIQLFQIFGDDTLQIPQRP